MADALPTNNNYTNLGGINQKASKYEMSTAQFLDLRNLDFDVPNALSKRPGSSYFVSSGTSGPIQSLFEFTKLTGESYLIAASDTALFYVTSNQYSLLSAGWNNGQPPDMLTFVNRLWVANGQSWISWDAATLGVLPVGLPVSPKESVNSGYTQNYLFLGLPTTSGGASIWTVGGATMNNVTSLGGTLVARAVYLAYSYVREDGYQGPADFITTARNVVRTTPVNGAEWFAPASPSNGLFFNWVGGYTVPIGQGITAINIWVGVDTIYNTGTLVPVAGYGNAPIGKMGFGDFVGTRFMGSITLLPSADLSRFTLFTTMPTSQLFLMNDSGGGGSATYWAATFALGGSFPFSYFDGSANLQSSFSGMPFNFFATNIPKYLEVNQNYMFMSGFSGSPSNVWFSDLGQPETIDADNFFEVRTNDGDKVFGMKAFNNQLIVAKEHSFSKLVGNSPDNFQLVDLSEDFGCVSNRTFVTKDQLLFWLDKKGIIQYNGANWQIISNPVEGIFRRMNLTAAKEKAIGAHFVYRNQLWWGIPVDGSTQNNITVVFDYLVNAWTFFDGFNPASFAYARGSFANPTVFRGDYSGMIHYFGASLFGDSNQGITCLAFTHFENSGGENQTTLWRRLFLDVNQVSGSITGTISGQMFANYDQSTVQSTFAVFQNAYQTRIEMGVQGKAIAAQFSHFSASLPLLINGYGWAQRGLRNV